MLEMPRRSARLQQAECNALPERATKRQRHEKPATGVSASRTPLADLSNSNTDETRAKSRHQIPTKQTQKAYKRTRSSSTAEAKQEAEYRLGSKPILQAETVPVTNQMKPEASRTRSQTRKVQERGVKQIGSRANSEKLLSLAAEQRKRARKPNSMQMTSSSSPKQSKVDSTAPSPAQKKSGDPSPPSPTHERKDASSDIPLPQAKDGNLPKPYRQNSPSPPLYPEDEIRPVPSQPKALRHERRPKRNLRPPSPPPLYPEDEIQPLPTKLKKTPSYGTRTKLKEVTNLKYPVPKPQPPRLTSQIQSAPSHQSPSLPISSSLLEHEDEVAKPSLLDEPSNAERDTQSTPRSRIVRQSSGTPSSEQLLQKDPSADLAPRTQTPGFRSELETRSIYKSQIGSKAAAPIHTYSKRRQNNQNLALPSRKSLGVRSRTSSGESPDSKDSIAYDSQSDQSDNDDESEDSEPEKSDREDPALVSFIGQQRKLWDEIDGIDLEEDLF